MMQQEQERIQTLKTKIRDFVQMYTQLIGDPTRIAVDDNRIIAQLNALAEDNTISDNAIKAYQQVVGKLHVIINFKYTRTVVTKKGGWFGADETQEQAYEPAIIISLAMFSTELRKELSDLQETDEKQRAGELQKMQKATEDAKQKAKLEKKARKEIEKKAEAEKREAEYKLREQKLEMLGQAAEEKKEAVNQALAVGGLRVLELVMDVISSDRLLTNAVETNYGGKEGFQSNIMVRWTGNPSTKEKGNYAEAAQEASVVQPESEMDKCKNYFGSKFGAVIPLVEVFENKNTTEKEKLLIQYLLFQLAYHKNNKSVSEITTEAKTFFVDACSLNLDPRMLVFLDNCLKNPEVMADAARKELSMDDCASIVRRLRCEKEPFLPKDEKAREIFALRHKFLKEGKQLSDEATEIAYKNDFMQKLALLSPRVTPKRLASGFWKEKVIAASDHNSVNSNNGLKH